MPTATLTKPQVALILELCAGVVKIIAADEKDEATIRALHQVKENVEQMIQTRAEPENIPSPRRTYEEDCQSDPGLRGTRRHAMNQFEHRTGQMQKQMEALAKARERALRKAREQAEKLEKVLSEIQDVITQAEATMEIEKDPKGGLAALERIEDIIDSEAETIHLDELETDDEPSFG